VAEEDIAEEIGKLRRENQELKAEIERTSTDVGRSSASQ
jgi:hypothetical protein